MKKPVRLGLVGLHFGCTVCRELMGDLNLPVRLTKVCDLDPARAEAASAEFNVPVSPSLDALLEDPEIDAIGLYTGPAGRANLIRKIIRAGKDVMTTKPFEVDADAAMEVLQEAAALKRVVHLNSPNARPYGQAAIINEWVREGLIGQPTIAQANAWVYYGKTEPDGTWYDDPLRCPLAPVFRIGIYPLNLFLSIFKDPVEVQTTSSRIETLRPTPDNASLTVRYKDGGITNILASFVVGSIPDRYRGGMVIGGTKGFIYFNTGPAARVGGPHANLVLSTDDRLDYRTVTRFAGDYDWEFFAQRVCGEVDRDVTTPEEIVEAIRVVNAMSESEQTGNVVRLA